VSANAVPDFDRYARAGIALAESSHPGSIAPEDPISNTAECIAARGREFGVLEGTLGK
jgi:hypothetical protein